MTTANQLAHRRVVVTGGSGFVGGHLARRLADEGHDVTSLDIAEPRSELRAGTRIVQVDIRDSDATQRAIVDARPDIVFHLAAQSSVAVSMREPGLDISTNVLGTLNVARAARRADARRLVFVSSGGAIYGAQARVPAAETELPAPASVYGASKAAAELYLAATDEAPDEVSVVRPANIYGPGQDPLGEAGVIAIFTAAMLAGDPVTIYGDGGQTRDYVHVTDVVEGLLRAADREPAVCNLGTGAETRTAAIYEMLADLTGYGAPASHAPERPGDVLRSAVSPARAGRLWGWEPRVALRDGLRETVEWFAEQGISSGIAADGGTSPRSSVR
jgi:UDP-glucose 4-epimerase